MSRRLPARQKKRPPEGRNFGSVRALALYLGRRPDKLPFTIRALCNCARPTAGRTSRVKELRVFHFLRRQNQTSDHIGTTEPTPTPETQRPNIALVLGGGAARGFAHIG